MTFHLMKMGAFASGHILSKKKKLPLTSFKSSFKRTNLLLTRRGKRTEKLVVEDKNSFQLNTSKKKNCNEF
jgi:hypothetical protein